MADERNPLSDHPFFSAPADAPPQPRELGDRLGEAMKPLPPEPATKDVLKDVGRSIVAEGTKGIAGALGGGAGSLETFAVKDLPEMVRGAGLWAGEKMDLLSPAERDRLNAEPIGDPRPEWMRTKFPEDRKKLIERGYASPWSGNLTYKGVTEAYKPLAKAAGIPALAYEPQTGAGKVAGAAAEFGGQNLLGPIAGTVGRVVTGAGAGAGSEILAQGADKDAEPIARLTGALVGGVGTGVAAGMASKLWNGVRGAVAPGSVAERELADALAIDIRRRQGAMAWDDLVDAYERGAPVSIADMAGPETRKVLGRYAEKTTGATDEAGAFNQALESRRAGAGPRLMQNLEEVMGGPIDAPALKAATEASGKLTRDNVYSLVRNEPAAQAIDQRPFMHLMERPLFKTAVKKVEETALDDPSLGIVVPSVTPAQPGTPSKILQTPRGFQNVPGTPATPQSIVPGNLSYWDQVQRQLREMGQNAIRAGEGIDAKAINDARSQLLKELDRVPGYTNARGVAFETFGAADAPEAGYKFFNTTNAFKRHEISDAVKRMTPEQRDLFGVGFAHAVSEMAAKDGLSGLMKRFTKDREFLERASLALGPGRVDQMTGHIISENLLSKVKQIPFIKQEGDLVKAAGTGAVGAAALDAAFLGGQISPEMAVKAAIGAGVAAGGRMALSAVERKIADKIVPMAVSQNPEDIARLGMMARQNRAVGTLMEKIASIVSAANTNYDRPQRASGGAVNLKALANAARKAVARSTQTLLKAPDEHVVKALEVANRHI